MLLQDLQKEIGQLSEQSIHHQNVTLVVASKYFRVDQIKNLYDLGVKDFGENKVQDAIEKIEALPRDIRWHFIGHLQKNKVAKVVDRFTLIHSVDSVELAQKISEKSERVQSVLLQVNVSQEASKSGFSTQEIKEALQQMETLKNIRVDGLMTMAPKEACPQEIGQVFGALQTLKEKTGNPSWHLSMGMSRDYQEAILQGSTMIRIGSLLKS